MPRLFVALLLAVLPLGPAAGQPARTVPKLAWSAEEIAALARTPYFEGVPYDLAASFPPAIAQPVLKAILADPAEAAAWPNAAAMLGIVGDDSAAATLIAFARGTPGATLSSDAARGKSSAVLGLGYLAQRTGNAAAIRWLGETARPGGATVSGVRWLSETAQTAAARDQQLSEVATLALGLAARPASRAALAALPRAAIGDDVVQQALRTDEAIRAQGPLGYYRLQDQPNLQRFKPGMLTITPQGTVAEAGQPATPEAATTAEITPAPETGQQIPPVGKSEVLAAPRTGKLIAQPGQGTPGVIPNPVPPPR